MICGATHAALQRSAMVWVRYAGRVWPWYLGPKAMALRWWHVGTRGLAGQRHSTRHYALGAQVFAPRGAPFTWRYEPAKQRAEYFRIFQIEYAKRLFLEKNFSEFSKTKYAK